jgi:hypothetical protein
MLEPDMPPTTEPFRDQRPDDTDDGAAVETLPPAVDAATGSRSTGRPGGQHRRVSRWTGRHSAAPQRRASRWAVWRARQHR